MNAITWLDIGSGLLAAMWSIAAIGKAGAISWRMTAPSRDNTHDFILVVFEGSLGVGLLLVQGELRMILLGLSAGALVVFATFVATQALRAPGVACDCFGAFVATTYSLRHAAFNLLLASLASVGAWISASNVGPGDLVLRLAAIAVGLAATATILVTIPAFRSLVVEA